MAMGFGSFSTPFTSAEGFVTLGIMTGIYYTLFLYLSLVLPNENGNNLHPLFFLNCLFKQKQST
jgi:hypothetical protein